VVANDWLTTLTDLPTGLEEEIITVVIAVGRANRAVERDVRGLGHAVLPAETLLEPLRPGRIDAVLLDLRRRDASALIAGARRALARRVTVFAIADAGVADHTLVQAIQQGVTGHLTPPLPIRLLDAWLRWAARRARRPLREATVSEPLQAHDSEPLQLDMACRSAWIYGHEVRMTQGVFDLLVVMHRYRNRVVGREFLLRTLFQVKDIHITRALDVRIMALRKAIAPLAQAGVPRVETVRGVGFQLIL
jgi:DNA-binding response OmpR family regulator